MLKGLLTHKEEAINQDILLRATSGALDETPVTVEEPEVGGLGLASSSEGIASEGEEEDEEDEDRQRALADIGNQLHALKKQKRATGGKPGWKKSRVTGRWGKA